MQLAAMVYTVSYQKETVRKLRTVHAQGHYSVIPPTFEYPKSQILMIGRVVPSNSVFSSLISRLATPCDRQNLSDRRAASAECITRLALMYTLGARHCAPPDTYGTCRFLSPKFCRSRNCPP